MLEAFEIVKSADSEQSLSEATEQSLTVTLTFEERQKSRYLTQTSCGKDIGWFIDRGAVLLDGDYLKCSGGELIRVIAANETVSQISSDDQFQLTRCAYHLGNRHVPLQIGAGFLRYQHDHVLDDMVVGLGMPVECLQAPFQPENGAYHNQSDHSRHHHSHDHSDEGHKHAGHSHS